MEMIPKKEEKGGFGAPQAKKWGFRAPQARENAKNEGIEAENRSKSVILGSSNLFHLPTYPPQNIIFAYF